MAGVLRRWDGTQWVDVLSEALPPLTKADVGLSNVDNTSDVNKPVSTTQQTALNGKANSIHSHSAVDITSGSFTVDLLAPAPVGGRFLYTSAATGFADWRALSKSDVGLSNVDNTTDDAKPVSVAQQIALDNKQDKLSLGTISQYLRGDRSWQTLDPAAVGAAAAVHTHTVADVTASAIGMRDNASRSAATGWSIVFLTGTPDHDTGDFAVSSSVATIPSSGLYQLSAQLCWDNVGSGRRILNIEKFTSEAVGSGQQLARAELPGSTTWYATASCSTDEYLTAGTKVRLVSYQNTGATMQVRADLTETKLNIRRVK